MLNTIIQKELRAIILSPKFTATFIVCTVLILLSIFTGIKEYQAAVKNYQTATSLTEDELKAETSWDNLETRLYREPDPMQILVAGLGYDIGRFSVVSQEQSVKLRHSAYSDDPIFAMFRFIDFAFIVQFVLTLLAILFTYDAVSGEREQGTLKLVFANPVPRTKFLIGKSIGAWIGLVVPISIPILLGLGMILLFGVDLQAHHWVSIFALVGLSLLLFTFFIVLGVLVSTLTSRSSASFLLSLVMWVLFVLIIPRSAIMAAGQFVNVPRVAEVDGQRDAFAANRWDEFYKSMQGEWGHFETQTNDDMTEEQVEEQENAMWAMIQQQDSLRREVEKEIEVYEVRLLEELQLRKESQQRLAFTMSRFSPVSAYQLAAMTLAQTDVADKQRWEVAMKRYREQFNDHAVQMQKENQDIGGVAISLTFDEETDEDGNPVEDSGGGNLSISGNRDKDVIDLSDLPRFESIDRSAVQTAGMVSIDFGILVVSILITFAIAYVGFIRYDIR